MSASAEVLMQQDSISYFKSKKKKDGEKNEGGFEMLGGFLRDELVDRLDHLIASEALFSQLFLGRVFQLALSGKVVGSGSSSISEVTDVTRQLLAFQVLQRKIPRVQTCVG